MLSLVSVVMGGCLGVLLAWSQVPRTQQVPRACVLILMVVGAGAMLMVADAPLRDGLLFASAALSATVIASAELWARSGLRDLFTRWELTWMSAFRPSYLRSVPDARRNPRCAEVPESPS